MQYFTFIPITFPKSYLQTIFSLISYYNSPYYNSIQLYDFDLCFPTYSQCGRVSPTTFLSCCQHDRFQRGLPLSCRVLHACRDWYGRRGSAHRCSVVALRQQRDIGVVFEYIVSVFVNIWITVTMASHQWYIRFSSTLRIALTQERKKRKKNISESDSCLSYLIQYNETLRIECRDSALNIDKETNDIVCFPPQRRASPRVNATTPRATRDVEGRWRARFSRREELVEEEGWWSAEERGRGEGCACSVTSSLHQPPVHSHRRQRWSGWSRWSPSRLATPRPTRRSNPTAASSPKRPPTAWTRPRSPFTTRNWFTR